MKNRPSGIIVGFTVFIVVLLGGVVAALLWRNYTGARVTQGTLPAATSPTTETPGPQNNIGQSGLKSEGGEEAWQPAPPCANTPMGAQQWQRFMAGKADSEVVKRAGALAPRSLLDGVGGAAAFQSASDPGLQDYQALLLNVASGRLNRSTIISLPEFPEIKTVGDLILQAGQQAQSLAKGSAYSRAVEKVLSGEAVQNAVCARLVVLQAGGSLEPVIWSEGGVEKQAAQALGMQAAGLAAANPIQANLDFGMPSPDGQWGAYTSLSMDAGGPIFIQNLQSGAWQNLIAAMNAARRPDQPELNESDWWAVIKWFPDSSRLFIGRSDGSSVLVVHLEDYTYQVYPFPGEGNGGTAVVDLSPDGSRFTYLGYDPDGAQVLATYEFEKGLTTVLLKQTFEKGVLYFPRFSPDGLRIAFLQQQGDPLTGTSFSIQLLSLGDGSQATLVEGNVGMTVPMWSPDGQYVAYTRETSGAPDVVVPGEVPEVESANVWTVTVATGQNQQITTLKGQARSPVWSSDSTTLAFITQEGKVGMATLYQPGRMWLAAETSREYPLLTSMFFVP